MKTGEHQHDPNETRPLHLRSCSADYADEDCQRQKPIWKQFNFWLVVFTGVYSVVSIALWCVTKNALQQQVMINRPVVFDNGMAATEFDEDGFPKVVHLLIRDFGKTVALRVTPVGHLEIGDAYKNAPKDAGCNPDGLAPDVWRSTLAPVEVGASGFANWTLPENKSAVALKKGGTNTLYVVGCIYYEGLDGSHYYSDVCTYWKGASATDFQSCADTDRNFVN